MANQLKKDAKIVLKLDLGEDGLRRIPLQKLWDEARDTVSYENLVALILDYKKLPSKAVQNERVAVSLTYTDEDGDVITISSDSELVDAFEQFTDSQPPVLRAKADVVKKKEVKKEQKKLKEMKKVAEQKNRDKNTVPIPGWNNLDKVDTPAVAPIVRLPVVAPPKIVKETVDAPDDTAGCDANFIHGRHTCDGCLTTPIFGLRYHAVNLPDYDLCAKCHGNYSGSDIIFKPMELDRDRHLQTRWQRRHMRRCRPMVKTQGLGHGRINKNREVVPSGTQTKKVIDGMDDALKEAIRRSLVDAWPVKKNKDKETEDAPVKKTVEKEGEPDIPVATVVDIEAGNEATQRALDTMDPKMKEALRKRLNVFFASRVNKGKEVDEENCDSSTLSPDEETQKKIDAMDPEKKEAIRRSLNQFFASRRASKGETKNQNDAEESEDNVKRTKEILDSMNEETKDLIRRSLNDFFQRRAEQNNSTASSEDEEKEDALPSVIVDIVVDDDLSVGTDDVDSAGGDDGTAGETDSGVSESNSKDEWQVVSEDDEMIAVAAQMLGSALFESDASIKRGTNPFDE